MEGDAPSENQKDISETLSTVSSCLSDIRVRKHVAVIETSSESEGESTEFDVSDLSFACSGDSEYLAGAQSRLLQEEIKIKNSHCTAIPDSDCDSLGLSNIKISVENPKYLKQIDRHTWTKKKKEEEKRKKLEERQRAKEQDAENAKIIANARSVAWINWMCKKKEDELKKQMNDIEACKREEQERAQRQIIAQQKFEEWVNKKKEPTKKDKHVQSFEEEEKKLQKKLTNLKKWEEWYSQKKTVKVPKSFTHMNYPKPAWVNPVPWCHPDPSTDCAASLVDSD